jgi:hypothetical protein
MLVGLRRSLARYCPGEWLAGDDERRGTGGGSRVWDDGMDGRRDMSPLHRRVAAGVRRQRSEQRAQNFTL